MWKGCALFINNINEIRNIIISFKFISEIINLSRIFESKFVLIELINQISLSLTVGIVFTLLGLYQSIRKKNIILFAILEKYYTYLHYHK